MPPIDRSSIDSQSIDSLGGCLLRAFSTVLGMVIVAACGLVILRKPAWTFGAADAVLWLTALAIVAAVHVEHRRAAASSVRSIAVRLVLAAAIWVAAQATQLQP